MGHKYDDDSDDDNMLSPHIVRIIVGAIIVGLLFMLFMWLLPVIGFLLTVGLVVLLIVLVALGIIWLFRSAQSGYKKHYHKKSKKMAMEE